MYRFIYSPYPKAKEAIQDLKKKIEEIDFKPNLAIFFLTESLISNFSDFSKLVECNSICMPVEGYMTPESVWTRGCLVLLMDTEYTLHVLKGPPDDVVSLIKRSKKGSSNFLIYPLIFVKSRLHMLKAGFRLQRLARKYETDPKKVLETASEIYEKEFIYPINKLLRPFRDAGVDAISFNIFPLNIVYGGPIIAVNGKKLGRKIVWISFKNKIESEFTDTLPERGSSFDDTKSIIKSEFIVGKDVKVEKKGITIGRIDEMKVSEFLNSEQIFLLKKELEEKFLEEFLPASPYGLYFISKETYGASSLGLTSYPIDLYPSLFELDSFFSEAIFIAETIKGGITTVMEHLKNKNYSFCALDHNILLMYESKVHQIKEAIKPQYSIFTSYPNYTSPHLKKRCMSEIERGIFINVMRNTIFLNLI